jgi:hypothetical protein
MEGCCELGFWEWLDLVESEMERGLKVELGVQASCVTRQLSLQNFFYTLSVHFGKSESFQHT